MRQTINTIFQGTGILIFMIGFLMLMKAAGMADCGGALHDLFSYALCGAITSAVGGFIAGWKI